MNLLKIVCIFMMLCLVETFGAELGERLSIPMAQRLVPSVEARVGRPLTPVSVAGVGRRTVRRCAVGVYNCGLPAPGTMESQPARVSADSTRPKKHPAVSS